MQGLPAVRFFDAIQVARKDGTLSVNLRYGRDTLRPGAVTQRPVWAMRRSRLSPRYTTQADEILTARA